MSRTGCCYDNAAMERFFWSLKHEWTNRATFENLEEVRRSAFQDIEMFYNTVRQHQTRGDVSPNQFEADHAPAPVAYRPPPESTIPGPSQMRVRRFMSFEQPARSTKINLRDQQPEFASDNSWLADQPLLSCRPRCPGICRSLEYRRSVNHCPVV